ncbi:hypothetical protein LTR53_009868 [Teratosphaeriaceae sp. CCFEE 6253]|nr:hypothetical protein LTR53_009868 [Teratosphaeriaceae sp. CCFEE 6253]
MTPYRFRNPNYQSYRSPYGPQYKIGAHFAGINRATAMSLGSMAVGFGAAAGIFALFFFDEVPKVKNDILKKIPVIGDFYVHEVAPEDNPF